VAQHLGLQVREQVIYQNGGFEVGAWMSTTAVHHELAYVIDAKGAHGRLHHISFWIDNREDVLRAADILSENGVFIETGPAKHNNSQAFYLYSYEPGGNRVEIYSGGYLVFAPDFQPVVWNEEERGTGVYWGGALPDSFLQYATPDVAASADEPVGVTPEVPKIDPL
ncbi:MAG: VOC family protein, partial [Alphaproteobacteria bacterium]|nr:VOC family protein [Alphaproteobacteria bacterium]